MRRRRLLRCPGRTGARGRGPAARRGAARRRRAGGQEAGPKLPLSLGAPAPPRGEDWAEGRRPPRSMGRAGRGGRALILGEPRGWRGAGGGTERSGEKGERLWGSRWPDPTRPDPTWPPRGWQCSAWAAVLCGKRLAGCWRLLGHRQMGGCAFAARRCAALGGTLAHLYGLAIVWECVSLSEELHLNVLSDGLRPMVWPATGPSARPALWSQQLCVSLQAWGWNAAQRKRIWG